MFVETRDTAKRFGASSSGAIAISFAIAAAGIFVSVGVAIDTARWVSAQRATVAAVDAAVLAGARSLQLNSADAANAVQVAQRTYAANMSSVSQVRDTITFAASGDGKSITASGTSYLDTTFMRVVGINDMKIAAFTGVDMATATIAPGGAGGSNIEVSLMLDVTGSMCNDNVGPCVNDTKIAGLKDAAKRLVDIVVSDDQSRLISKVALVPFSTRVRVGPNGGGDAMMLALTGLPSRDDAWRRLCTRSTGSGASEGSGNWQCQEYETRQVSDWKIMPCVTDRFYNDPWRFDPTDASPGPGAWLNAHDGGRMSLGPDSSDTAPTSRIGATESDPANNWNYDSSGGCGDVDRNNEVMPLTSNKVRLRQQIDGLRAYGSTAGALGTAWAYYMLSPNWAGIFAGESAPRPYAELSTLQPSGAPVTRKVAVLMTDGGYNTYRGWKGQNQQTVSDYAISVCDAMKARGIEIFTVGFALQDLPASERAIAEATLMACGTDISHFYQTLNVSQLHAAFQSIGTKLTTIRLTK